ncbi:MAG: M23 family metallopeptidase [Elusimicrobia bacterium]|nr:M23 family metallopeptidase [Elusimicrobiota bacterium]
MGFLPRLYRTLSRHVTVLIIPHTNLPTWKLRFTFNFFLFCLALWSGVTMWAGLLIGRNVDYWITKADNQVMRTKVSYLVNEMQRSMKELDQARDTDKQMRVLLGMRSKKAIIEQEEGVGGPAPGDRVGLVKEFLRDPMRFNVSTVRSSLMAMRQESQQRMASFQEIAWYITNRRSLFRATPQGWPAADGRLTSGFGFRFSPVSRGDEDSGEFHAGIDIASSADTPILATADGIVRRAEWTGGYGKMVLIEHAWGYSTLYGHTSKVLVHKGEAVRRGQMIAYMGTTGRSTGTHVHYEVWRNGKAVNPNSFLKRPDEDTLAR